MTNDRWSPTLEKPLLRARVLLLEDHRVMAWGLGSYAKPEERRDKIIPRRPSP